MKNVFAYSILQYRHSLALGEALNVGIVFAFPEFKKYTFKYAHSHRLRLIYPGFTIRFYTTPLLT